MANVRYLYSAYEHTFLFFQRKKAIGAIVYGTLKFKPIIDEIIAKISLNYVNRGDMWLTRVLVYGLLFGKGLSQKEKKLLGNHASLLSAELARMKVHRKVTTNEELIGEAEIGMHGTSTYFRS